MKASSYLLSHVFFRLVEFIKAPPTPGVINNAGHNPET